MRRPTVVILIPKTLVGAVAAVLAAACLVYYLGGVAVRTTAPFRDAVCGRTVVIDPGHGGIDPGAIGRSGLVEKDVNLAISLALKPIFNRYAVYTVLTRDRDVDLCGGAPPGLRKRADLAERVQIARKSKADVFLSIHCNSFPGAIWSGAQVFYNAGDPGSKLLAECIQSSLIERLGPNARKAKSADIYLLKNVGMPAVTIEVGFLSNPREEGLLATPEYRQKVAEAIHQGTVQYFLRVYGEERRDESGPAPQGPAVSDSSWSAAREAMRPGPSVPSAELKEDEIVLYFAGPSNLEDALMPEIREVPGYSGLTKVSEKAEVIMKELVKGPGQASILHPTIPHGTIVRGVQVSGSTARVNLSKEFLEGFWGGSRSEELTVYSIVNSLTEMPEINKVIIFVEGEPLTTISGHMVIEGPLERNLSVVTYGK